MTREMTTEEAIEYLTRCADGLDPDFECAVSMAVSAIRAQQNGGWISVKDRLPELNQWVWIRIAGHRFKAYRASGGGCWYIEEYNPEKFRDCDVTHWMPIIEGGG